MSFFKRSKKRDGEGVRKKDLPEDSDLAEGSASSGACKGKAKEDKTAKRNIDDETEKKTGLSSKDSKKGTPKRASSKGSQGGQQPSEPDSQDRPTTETDSLPEGAAHKGTSEHMGAEFLGELEQEPKSNLAQSSAVRLQVGNDTQKKEQEKLSMEQNKLEKLEEDNKQLREKVDWYSNQLMKCDKQREALEGEVSMMKTENEALKNEAKNQEKELTTAVDKLKLKDEQCAAVNLELVGVQNELTLFQAKMLTLEADLKTRQDECDGLKKDIAKKTEKVEEDCRQISELSTTLLQEKEKKSLVDTELKNAQATIAALQVEVEKWHKEHDLMVGKLETNQNQLQNDLEALGRKSIELQSENAAKEAEMKKKEEDNAKLENRIKELLLDKELEKEKQMNELVALQNQLKEAEAEKVRILDSLATVEANLLGTTKQNSDLEATRDQLKRDVEDLVIKSKELQSESAAKEAEMKKKEEDNAKLEHRIKELLLDKELEKEKQMNELVALQNQLKEVEAEKVHTLAKVEANLLRATEHIKVLEDQAIASNGELVILREKSNIQKNLLDETKAALDEAEKKIADEAKQRDEDKKMWEAQIQEKDNQLGREMVALELQRAALLKEKEIKQQHEVTLLAQNQRLEASERHTNDLNVELRKLEGEKFTSLQKLQQLEKERTELQTTLDNAVAETKKIEDNTKREIAYLKDQIQQYEVKVEERDRMIDQLKSNLKSERKYFKSDKEDEEICNNVSKLVEYYTGHSDEKMQSECFNTKIKDLELRVEQLTEQNKEFQITHQSPTASLMPSSSIMLREALQLNEAESTGLKEEITGLRGELETYQANCKRQSEAIVKLKEELGQIKCELVELQEYKHNAEDELRSLRAKSAAHDSLNYHVLTPSEDMCVQVETLKNEKEALHKDLQLQWVKIEGLTKVLSETKTRYEVVQVALQESDTTHASEVNKLKHQISKLESEKEKLSKSCNSVCVELQTITDKCKDLEETIVLLQTQVETYKKDFENERSDRERLAHETEKAKLSKAVKQNQHQFHEDEKVKQVQLESLQEAYTMTEKEVSDLKQKLQTKEKIWKRSLEEARASSLKLEEEVMVLTQQVKQYKKQADNLKSQLEKFEQMNKIQVQQPRHFQSVDSDANYQQVKRIAQQPDPMWRQQQQHEDAHMHHLKEHAPSGFPPPSDNVYQGYGYQSSPVYASERDPVVKVPSSPPEHSPRQEASHDDDDLPPPIMLPSQPSPSPVKVQAATVQPYNTPYQQPYQSQSQQSGRYAQTGVDGVNYGPPIQDHFHHQREQLYVNPHPQPRQPVQNSPHVIQPGAMKEPKPDQGIDLAKGIDQDISNVVVKLQADGSASNVLADVPFDPNLTCPVCRTPFRKGEIQAYKCHVKNCGK